MKDSAKKAVSSLFDVISAHGVTDVVCSPGSRNAPLIIAAECRKHLKKHVIVDERTAAFTALGIAIVSRRPVALVCTSGTALLNYAPAIAEAFYQGIPLIVISADRPKEWIDQDDSQTIRQYDALENFVKQSYDISDREVCDGKGWYENRVYNDAMLVALNAPQGPVHINLRLSSPLQSLCDYNKSEASLTRVINQIPDYPMPSKQQIRQLALTIRGKKIMLVAGFMNPDSKLNKGILRFSRHGNVTIMAETISNLHLPQECYAIDSVLSIMDENTRHDMTPDVIISVGGAIVSRMLKTYLRKCGNANNNIIHWSLGKRHTTVDCFQCLTMRIDADPALFINTLSAELAHLDKSENPLSNTDAYNTCNYADEWNSLKRNGMERIRRFENTNRITDMAAVSEIYRHLQPEANLCISNGTLIRYDQIIPHTPPHATFCNRGVSGIDGSTSTALGCALKYHGETYLLTGDTSFSYDLGALAANVTLCSSIKIIVINNSGGAIFRFIPSTSHLECLEKYFCANPSLDISKVSDAFGFTYRKINSYSELSEGIDSFCKTPGPAILEIKTDPEESNAILKKALNK